MVVDADPMERKHEGIDAFLLYRCINSNSNVVLDRKNATVAEEQYGIPNANCTWVHQAGGIEYS